MLTEIGSKPNIDVNSLFWLEAGARKREKLQQALDTIDQELHETPDHHKTEKRLNELVRGRYNLWVTFQSDWEDMMKEVLMDSNEIRNDVRESWGNIEKLTTQMIIKHAKEVDQLQGTFYIPGGVAEDTPSIKMKMD